MPATVPITVFHGLTKNAEATELLRRTLEESETAGTLIIGYPPKVDAVLVSDQGHVTVFHVTTDPKDDHVAAQDQAWIQVDRILRMKQEFRARRDALIKVQSVTLNCATGAEPDDTDPEHPVAVPANLLEQMERFHRQPPPGPPADHDSVVDQVLWVPPAL